MNPLTWQNPGQLFVAQDVIKVNIYSVAELRFIRIFHSFDKFRENNSFRAWIFRIATNEALRLIETRKQDYTSLETESNEVNRITADSYVDYSDLETVRLQKAILTLPTKQQLAFNLRYYDEMSYEEIAEATGSSPSSAKMNFHIAKEKIIKYMNSNEKSYE